MHLIDDHAQKAGIPLRFAASKIMEGDKKITEKLDLSRNEKEMLEHTLFRRKRRAVLTELQPLPICDSLTNGSV